eukprot:SAG31_NODE_69_length_28130_cov_15.318219_20_plen_309_part_00
MTHGKNQLSASVDWETFSKWWKDQHTAEKEQKRREQFWDEGRGFRVFSVPWQRLDIEKKGLAMHLGWDENSWEADRLLLDWRLPSVVAGAAAARQAETEKKRADEKKLALVGPTECCFCDISLRMAGRFLLNAAVQQAPSAGLKVHGTTATFGPQKFELKLLELVKANPLNLVIDGSGKRPRVKATNHTAFSRNVVLIQRGGSKGFLEKVLYAQAHDACGVVFIDTEVSAFESSNKRFWTRLSRTALAFVGLARWRAVSSQCFQHSCPRFVGPPKGGDSSCVHSSLTWSGSATVAHPWGRTLFVLPRK